MKLKTKQFIFNILESVSVKLLLSKLILSSTSLQGWLVTLIVEKLFDKIAVPLLNASIRQGELFYDQSKGSIQIKRLDNAKDINEYSDGVRDILQ